MLENSMTYAAVRGCSHPVSWVLWPIQDPNTLDTESRAHIVVTVVLCMGSIRSYDSTLSRWVGEDIGVCIENKMVLFTGKWLKLQIVVVSKISPTYWARYFHSSVESRIFFELYSKKEDYLGREKGAPQSVGRREIKAMRDQRTLHRGMEMS